MENLKRKRPQHFVGAIIFSLFFAISITLPSNATAWDASSCKDTLASGGAIVGGTIGFFGDAIKTFLSGGATLASDAASGGTATGTGIGITLGGAIGRFSSSAICPTSHPMPKDEATSLYEVLHDCRSEYYNFLNPLPFTDDTDFCTLPGNPFIRSHDTKAREGYQVSARVVLKKLKYQLDAGIKNNGFPENLITSVEEFSKQLEQCSKSYSDRFSTSNSDYCVIETSGHTAYLWNRTGNQVTIPAVLEASIRLLRDIEQKTQAWQIKNQTIEVHKS